MTESSGSTIDPALVAWLDANDQRLHDDLFEFLRIPSVSARSEHTADVARAARQAIDEARDAPAGSVVGQQALQFYELAALHLSQPQPKLDDARVAIDAFAAVVTGLGSRLGEAEQPLLQALNQIQLAFVEVSRSAGGTAETAH